MLRHNKVFAVYVMNDKWYVNHCVDKNAKIEGKRERDGVSETACINIAFATVNRRVEKTHGNVLCYFVDWRVFFFGSP